MRDEPLVYTSAAGQRDGTVIMKLAGPLTLTTMFALQTELRSIKPAVLILDLTETPYMDSAGLGLIMNYYVSAGNGARKLLLAGVNDRIMALLDMTKVREILQSFPTVAAAEASL
jgi:anti-anti-sigma factor